MRVKVYKALDKPSSFFGLKGIYIRHAVTGVVAALAVGVFVGRFVNGLIGVGVFFGAALLVYVLTLKRQYKYPERDRKRLQSAGRIPDYISIPPRSFRSYLVPGLKPRK